VAEPLVVGYGQNKWIKDANTKAMGLFAYNLSSIEALHDDNNNDYQVPAGKKFIVLRIDVIPRDDSSGVILTQDSSAGVSGTRFFAYNDGGGSSTPTTPVSIDYYAEIDAGNYINAQMISYGNVSIFGVETNA
jgi:hypothetical protein